MGSRGTVSRTLPDQKEKCLARVGGFWYSHDSLLTAPICRQARSVLSAFFIKLEQAVFIGVKKGDYHPPYNASSH
jgi:hypothetical protein